MTDMETIARRISSALNDRDMTAFGSLIAEDAKWGQGDIGDERACHNCTEIIKTYKRLLDQGVGGTVVETMTGDAGVACHLEIDWPENAPDRRRNDLYQVFLVEDGLVTRIEGMDDRELAIEKIRP